MKRYLFIILSILVACQYSAEASAVSGYRASETSVAAKTQETSVTAKTARAQETSVAAKKARASKAGKTARTAKAGNMAKDAEGHTLVELWKVYYDARKENRPQDELKALDAIKAEVMERNEENIASDKPRDYVFDYYDACRKYTRTGTSINWKMRDSLIRNEEKELQALGEPIVLIASGNMTYDKLRDYILSNRGRLSAARHPDMFALLATEAGEADLLNSYMENDFEAALWKYSKVAQDTLSVRVGRYPIDELIEFNQIVRYRTESNFRAEPNSRVESGSRAGRNSQEENGSRVERNSRTERNPWAERDSLLQEYSRKYQGKAVALLAEDRLLSDRYFNRYTYRAVPICEWDASDENASAEKAQEYYLKVRDDCKALSKKIKKAANGEGPICNLCKGHLTVLEDLENEGANARIMSDTLNVYFQNTASAVIRIRKEGEKKTVYRCRVVDEARRYHITDTVKVALPDFDDGDYEVLMKAGKILGLTKYGKYTISAAFREDNQGAGVFAADYLSGKPLEGVELIRKDKEFQCRMQEPGGRVRLSERSPVNGNWSESNSSRIRCMLLTDRTAFNPGETVHFKVIVYQEEGSRIQPLWNGVSVKAVLRDAEHKVISERDLIVDEMRGCNGEFVLERRQRGGIYSLEIIFNNKTFGKKSLTVDDFVLPTFELTFDEDGEIHHPGDTVHVTGTLRSFSGHPVSTAQADYSVTDPFGKIAGGPLECNADGRFDIVFTGKYSWNHIRVNVTDETGETRTFEKYVGLEMNESERPRQIFQEMDSLAVNVIPRKGPVWALFELHDAEGNRLLSEVRELKGEDSLRGEDQVVSFPYLDTYTDVVELAVCFFKDMAKYHYHKVAQRPDDCLKLPLTMSRFTDKSWPGGKCDITVKSIPGAEISASVFDVASERISKNIWSEIRRPKPEIRHIQYSFATGGNSGFIYGSHVRQRNAMRKNALGTGSLDYKEFVDEEIAEEEALPFYSINDSAIRQSRMASMTVGMDADIPVRSDFAGTLAWVPALKVGADSTATFSFTAGDKLSTFCVQVFAHDAQLRSAAMRREMLVTLPLEVKLVPPQFLYAGDRYTASASVSTILEKPVAGTMGISWEADGKRFSRLEKITIPASGTASFKADMDVPACDTLKVTASFVPEDRNIGSDALRVGIPVLKQEQVITEAHSAILDRSKDREALVDSLRRSFVNCPGTEAKIREISILDMLRDAVPEYVEPCRNDILSLSEAVLARHLLRSEPISREPETILSDDVLAGRILALQNADGGFCWFTGLDSSPVLTAAVIERLQGCGSGFTGAMERAVKYLDNSFFNEKDRPSWRGAISLSQYLYIRSIFPEVEYEKGIVISADFRKSVRAYLNPDDRRLGWIFSTARRCLTLKNLLSSDAGKELASRWGIFFDTEGKLQASLDADIESLSQYAVAHPSGGIYFPNAVMPWRGLLESELYAHCTICRLLEYGGRPEMAEGIRKWIMVQKETQQWSSDPACIDALATVLNGSRATLDTKVMALESSTTLPFRDIKAAGNGFRISCRYLRQDGGSYVEIQDGESVTTGERIRCILEIWNEENRSFVHVSAPRQANLRPVNQLSGRYSWNGYRSVGKERSEYWFDSYPEMDTVISEDYYVIADGKFHRAAPEIESLYAPHYRANGTAE